MSIIYLKGDGSLSRPTKWRRICCLPNCNRFGPLDEPVGRDHLIIMTVDEYETIRLIDLEDFSQEEGGQQMNIGRTTVQRIYTGARKKLAEAIVYGKVLRIEGGDYDLCGENARPCGKGCCRRHQSLKNE